jgi:glycosyltransferase involved in cell wall biosynthesis
VNIVLFAPFRLDGTGGITRIVWSLQSSLRERGHRTYVLKPGDSDTVRRVDGDVYEIYLRLPIPNARLLSWLAVAAYLPVTLSSLGSFLRREAIDVVHVVFPNPTAVYLALLRPLARWKLVLGFQGRDINELHERARGHRLVMRWVVRQADWITLCASSMAERLAALAPATARKVWVVPNANPLSSAPRPSSRPAGSLAFKDFVLSVGSLIPRKGHDVLIRALAVARERGHRLPLVIVGGGPSRPDLHALARDLDIADQVHFAGDVDHGHVTEYFERCRYFVLATRAEGMPLAVAEAMSFGKAVVATRVDGIPEMIKNHKTGLLVPSEDVEALAAAMIRLEQDHGLRADLGERARAFALEEHSWSRFTERNLLAYRQALTGAVAGPRP